MFFDGIFGDLNYVVGMWICFVVGDGVMVIMEVGYWLIVEIFDIDFVVDEM